MAEIVNEVVVSIIIPVYNSEKYISRCLESVINQFDSKEIICVDDHSTDGSLLILKSYAKQHPSLKIISHDVNNGPLISRYDGVIASIGKYIMFVDSDDCLCPNACEELSKMMDDSGADMIHFGTKVMGSDKALCMNFKDYVKPYLGILKDDCIFNKQFSIPICWNLWNRIYKSSICKKGFSHVKMENINFGEDVFLMFYISYYSHLYYGINDEYYIYSFGDGISTKEYSISQRIVRKCKTAGYTKQCIKFIKNENKYEQYGRLCNSYPISFFDLCVDLLIKIENDEEKEAMCELIYSTYRDRFVDKIYFERYVSIKKELNIIYSKDISYIDKCSKLEKENTELKAIKHKLENSTIKAIKNVICSFIRKIRYP